MNILVDAHRAEPFEHRQAAPLLPNLIQRSDEVVIRPGPRHWLIFRQLCERSKASGKLVADAAHAALAIESGCEWVTADTDFSRFEPQLRWRLLQR